MIIPIGRWVLETACRQLAAWDRAHPADRDRQPTMAVNLSPWQLSHDPDLVDAVTEALDRNALSPHRLCLEVTETAVHQASPIARASLKALAAAGEHFALDDYGTGFSSLAHLRDIPVAALKIDRVFVAGLGFRGDDAIVVAARTVVALQTLVSREQDPSEPAVVTVGSIRAGTKHNIIPNEAKLQITVRSYKPDPSAYTLATRELNVPREAVIFVPSADWDMAGAKWYGYATYWANRARVPLDGFDVAADIEAPDLAKLPDFVLQHRK